ncbi:MFS transporter [Nonomuraea sp. NPDC046802]|uniref:MFS transporter n=1 Tax=Nonomuraea sp. NPDC046802 TaxID=3154919 RepID=UPI0033D900DE
MHDQQPQRYPPPQDRERPAWALIGPGIAALTGLYLLTMSLWPTAQQAALHLSGQTVLLTTVVSYLVSAAAGGALGAGLGARLPTTAGMSAIAFLIIGVLLDGFAPNAGILLIGRVLSGLGAGGAVGTTVALVRRTGRHRGVLVAILAGLGLLALIAGPFVNRWLSMALTWRFGYLIALLPLAAGLVAAAVSGLVLLSRRPAQPVPAGVPYPPAGQRPWNAPPET